VSVTALEQVSTLEDAVALGLAADEFLLDALKVFCVSEIKRLVTVETVWNTLNSIVLVPDLPEACSQVKFVCSLITDIALYFYIKGNY